MTKYKAYYWLWYRVVQYLIPVQKGEGPFRSHRRNVAQFKLAKLFGVIHGVIFGDSEVALMSNYRTMSKFSSLVINISQGGTTPKIWVDYFLSTGKELYKEILRYKQVTSNGGNCALKQRMNEIPISLRILHEMFPDSWMILIPPVYASWLKGISPTIKQEIDLIRLSQRSIWQHYIINTYDPFLDKKTGEAIKGILEDPVHFSDFAVSLIQPVMDIVI